MPDSHLSHRLLQRLLVTALCCCVVAPAHADNSTDSRSSVIESARSGNWSASSTWTAGRVPSAGARVLIREGHRVVYDVNSDQAIRGISVAGVLSFATDRDTRLDVGLIVIQAGNEYSESGFDCEHHIEPPTDETRRPALEVGTANQPVANDHTARIRLVYFEGMDRESCPAIVCCAGRMDFHGAPLRRTWLKLDQPANAGDRQLVVQESVDDWRVGDQIIVTATTRQNKIRKTFRPSTRDSTQTEERTISAIDGATITLDQPLQFDHIAAGDYRADVANLSRNVVVESAEPDGIRGHTMYHRHSAGSISYAEFRHLGKQNVLGRYSLHFHLVGDTMRGSSVIGASIHDSHNRWLTIHGTNYLVVRDCVGYQSVGHGFFMEDGTEVYNVLDRNLAVQAYIGKPLPKQVIPFDKNDGSGFWWANCHNTFTRNVACDCDEYGYFFQAAKTPDFDPVLSIRQPDGSSREVDIRTLSFVRFDSNESHCQRRHAFNLGGGVPFGTPNVDGIGPDVAHPFVIRNMLLWNVHWAIHPVSPSVLLENFDIHDAEYGVWRPVYENHAYRSLHMTQVPNKRDYAFVDGPPPNGDAPFPKPLAPVDDEPPATVITHVQPTESGRLLVRGTTSDNGQVSQVTVNGNEVRQLAPNYAEWELTLDTPRDGVLTAASRDAAGNVEQTPDVQTVPAIEPQDEQPAKKAEHALQPGGTLTIEFPDMPQTFFAMQQKRDVPAQMTVYLPTNYDPAKKFPLLIWLSGGDGGNGTTVGVARELTQGRDFVCVSMPLFKASLAPVSGPKGPRPGFVINAADGELMWPHFKTMLDKLEQVVVNIDPDHRVLGGFSNGAHATAALIDASDGEVARRFSAFLFVEGGGKLQQYDLLKDKPVLMVSSNAKSQPRAQEICDMAKAAGARATLVVEDVGAHDFPKSAYPAVRDWLRTSDVRHHRSDK